MATKLGTYDSVTLGVILHILDDCAYIMKLSWADILTSVFDNFKDKLDRVKELIKKEAIIVVEIMGYMRNPNINLVDLRIEANKMDGKKPATLIGQKLFELIAQHQNLEKELKTYNTDRVNFNATLSRLLNCELIIISCIRMKVGSKLTSMNKLIQHLEKIEGEEIERSVNAGVINVDEIYRPIWYIVSDIINPI